MFKLTLPEEDGFYAELVAHPKVAQGRRPVGRLHPRRGQRPPGPQQGRDRQLLPGPHRGAHGPADRRGVRRRARREHQGDLRGVDHVAPRTRPVRVGPAGAAIGSTAASSRRNGAADGHPGGGPLVRHRRAIGRRIDRRSCTRAARSGHHPLRRRLRRRHAAHRRSVHQRQRAVRERPADAAGLPGRDPCARRHPRRGVRLPGAHLRPRDHHAGRRAQRARGDEPGRAAQRARRASSRAAR